MKKSISLQHLVTQYKDGSYIVKGTRYRYLEDALKAAEDILVEEGLLETGEDLSASSVRTIARG